MDKDGTDDKGYQLEIVEKCSSPEGISGDDWHYYVIVRGISRIDGKRAGTLKEVTAHAKDLAERINKRVDKYGMVFASSYTPRSQS